MVVAAWSLVIGSAILMISAPIALYLLLHFGIPMLQ